MSYIVPLALGNQCSEREMPSLEIYIVVLTVFTISRSLGRDEIS